MKSIISCYEFQHTHLHHCVHTIVYDVANWCCLKCALRNVIVCDTMFTNETHTVCFSPRKTASTPQLLTQTQTQTYTNKHTEDKQRVSYSRFAFRFSLFTVNIEYTTRLYPMSQARVDSCAQRQVFCFLYIILLHSFTLRSPSTHKSMVN